MTRLALAAKCGSLDIICPAEPRGAVVACVVAGGPARARPPPTSSDASAILPTPIPQVSKNCRRVMSRSSARVRAVGCWQSMARLLLGHRLVQVQDRSRDGRPGRQLGQVALEVGGLFRGVGQSDGGGIK